MRILEAVPKDIHFLTEFSFIELKHLQTILDNMVFNYDGAIEEHVQAKKYLEERLYPIVADTIKELEDGP